MGWLVYSLAGKMAIPQLDAGGFTVQLFKHMQRQLTARVPRSEPLRACRRPTLQRHPAI
jgi:hypothetical protein